MGHKKLQEKSVGQPRLYVWKPSRGFDDKTETELALARAWHENTKTLSAKQNGLRETLRAQLLWLIWIHITFTEQTACRDGFLCCGPNPESMSLLLLRLHALLLQKVHMPFYCNGNPFAQTSLSIYGLKPADWSWNTPAAAAAAACCSRQSCSICLVLVYADTLTSSRFTGQKTLSNFSSAQPARNGHHVGPKVKSLTNGDLHHLNLNQKQDVIGEGFLENQVWRFQRYFVGRQPSVFIAVEQHLEAIWGRISSKARMAMTGPSSPVIQVRNKMYIEKYQAKIQRSKGWSQP